MAISPDRVGAESLFFWGLLGLADIADCHRLSVFSRAQHKGENGNDKPITRDARGQSFPKFQVSSRKRGTKPVSLGTLSTRDGTSLKIHLLHGLLKQNIFYKKKRGKMARYERCDHRWL